LTLETTGREHIESICQGLHANGLRIRTERG
jgi:hypothetical protein